MPSIRTSDCPAQRCCILVDAQVGDEKVEGAEIIGSDPARGRYVTRYFSSDEGARTRRASWTTTGDWSGTMRSEKDRFTGTFNDERT